MYNRSKFAGVKKHNPSTDHPQKVVGIGNRRNACGTGRVIIPSNTEDRDSYVEKCFRTTTLSILNRESLDIMHNVDVDPEILERITFPVDSDTLGSSVFWINVPIYNKAVIIAKLNNPDEIPSVGEKEFIFMRDGEKGTVSIIGSGKKGELLINVTGKDSGYGKFTVSIGNPDGTGSFDLNINGTFNISTSGAISTRSYELDRRSVKSVDEEKETYSEITYDKVETRLKEGTSGHKIEEDSYEIGKGDSTASLAEEVEKMFHDILDELAKSQVTTALGPSPLLNIAQLQALKANTKNIFSKYLKIQ